MRKKALLAVLAVLLVALVGAVLYSLTRPDPLGEWPPPSSSPSTHSSQHKLDKRVIVLEKSLNSADGQTQLNALTPSLRQAYTGLNKSRFLPKGATLRMTQNTFVARGNAANVDATIRAAHTPTAHVVLILARADAGAPWQLLDMRQNTQGR